MSVARCREINARLRAAGVVVHEWAGWEYRGNGQSSAYEGALVHHTATPFGFAPRILVDGRSDLSGPLCNYAGNVDGSVTVIAAHPANHAGASGGRSMGPLPVTSLFNRRVLGLEIVYPGNVPMKDAQYRTALLWSRIATDVVGFGNIDRARAHAETSITGKWDPGFASGLTINMLAFRRAAEIAGAPAPVPPPSEEDDMTVAYVKGNSTIPIPGTNNVWGDVVFLVEWDAQQGVARARVVNASDPGYRLWLALDRPIRTVDQDVIDAIHSVTPDEAAAALGHA